MNTLDRYNIIREKIKKYQETNSLLLLSRELAERNIFMSRQQLENYKKPKKRIYVNVLKNIEYLEIFFESYEDLIDND